MAEWLSGLAPGSSDAAQLFAALLVAVLLVRLVRFSLGIVGLGR